MDLCYKTIFICITDEKVKLLELEQQKFANEFIKKHGDRSWSEDDVSKIVLTL